MVQITVRGQGAYGQGSGGIRSGPGGTINARLNLDYG